TVERRLAALADEHQLHRHVGRVGRHRRRAQRARRRRRRRASSGVGAADAAQLLRARAQPLAADAHLGAPALELLEHALPAERAVADAAADDERSRRLLLHRRQLRRLREQLGRGGLGDAAPLARAQIFAHALGDGAELAAHLGAKRFQLALLPLRDAAALGLELRPLALEPLALLRAARALALGIGE